MKYAFILIALLTLLTACTLPSSVECEVNADCELPIEYAIRSNCPFEALCIANSCQVACPVSYNNPYLFCESVDDCDCSNRGNASLSCQCIDRKCYSLEE